MRALILLVGLAGCGSEPAADAVADPKAPASKAQEFQAFVPSAAPPSVAPVSVTAGEVAARLVGAWKPDVADVATDADLLRLPKAAQAEAIAAATRILEQVGLEFGADGAVTLRDGAVSRSGRYVVEAEEAGAWRVRVALAREEEAPQEEVLSVRFEGAALRIAGTDGKSRRFVRR